MFVIGGSGVLMGVGEVLGFDMGMDKSGRCDPHNMDYPPTRWP